MEEDRASAASVRIAAILNVALVAIALAWAADLFPLIPNFNPLLEQVLCLSLGIASSAALLNYAAGARSTINRIVAAVVAIAMLVAVCYIISDFWQFAIRLALAPPLPVFACAIILLGMIWALQVTSGLSIVLVVALFFAFAALGHLLPAAAATPYTPLDRLIMYLVIDTNSVLGVALNVGLTVVVPYIVFGALLSALGGASFFTDLAFALMGRYRGGQAKVASTASALFGTVSGSAVGNVVSTGVVTIPLMKKAGYRNEEAGAIEAVASTGGQLVPPVLGATAFVMAEFLAIPYVEVVLASLVPAFLYYLSLFVQVDLIAARRGITGSPVKDLPKALSVLYRGWHFLLPFIIIFVMLFHYGQRPETAALVATAVLLVVGTVRGYDGRRASLRDVLNAFVSAGDASARIVIICAAAGIVIGSLGVTGSAFSISSTLLFISGNNIVLLLCVTALLSIVLGMGMPTVGIYVLLASLIAPVLVRLGIEPIAAHMFILYFGLLSMVTPPVALASFAASNIAGADPWKTSWQSLRLGWSAYVVPFVFVASPAMLLTDGHSALEMIHVSVTATIGIIAFCVGSIGYGFQRLNAFERMVVCAAGILALMPATMGRFGYLLEAAGITILVLFLILHLRKGARSRQETNHLVAGRQAD